MKIRRKFATALGLASLMIGAQTGLAISPDASANSVVVRFQNSENFADVKNGTLSNEKSEARVLESIEEAFHKHISAHLKFGYKVEIEVENVDLAGDQSTLTSTFGDFRVMTAAFPPRIAFNYTITDPSEKIVASGRANLSDLNYQNTLMTPARRSGELAPYVKELISDWASRDLRRAMAS